MKQLRIKIWRPDRNRPQKLTLNAGIGLMFKPDAEDHILSNVSEDLERQFPLLEYRMVQVGPNEFNFLYKAREEEEEVCRVTI